jgi:Ca2+:H+ antiporter
VMPAIFAAATQHREPEHLESISLDISWVLIASYVASLLFQLKTHQRLFAPPGEPPHHGPAWPLWRSLSVLLAAAVLVGFVSEFLVGAIHAAGEALGLSKVFMGVVVIAIIGNAAEHSTAVLMAARNKMDLAFGIAMGSSMQIALFVAPVLVIAGHLIGQPLGLEFTLLEVAAVMLSAMAVAHLASDGRTNWFEGFQLLAIYAILAIAFYYI